MTSEGRLAEIVAALEAVGLSCLVMGGHAVRYYGWQRHTNDFDLCLAPDGWDDLAERLRRTGLFGGGVLPEGNSWRPAAFRRFQLGRLAGGSEEWLEFWRHNHLLGPFADLLARREIGSYGGRPLGFLGVADLIRSKETERAKDWDDIAYLEEVEDARWFATYGADATARADALARLRSRRGFETYLASGAFADVAAVRAALAGTSNPITQAFLLPWAPAAVIDQSVLLMEPLVEARLRSAVPASPLHRTLVEVVRRQYKALRQAQDRADKERIRVAQDAPRP